MSKQPQPSKTQKVTPYLLYEDVASALSWLAEAFGFLEFGERFVGKDGKIQHAAIVTRDGGEVILMGCPGPTYKNPRKLGSSTQSLYIHVDDVDKHFAQAIKAKPKVLHELEDTFYGDRRYAVEDPEGHQWYFAQHVRDVSNEEMQKAMKG